MRPTDDDGDAAFARRILLTIVLIAAVATLWMLADILLLAFASVLLAVALSMIAQPINRWTGMGRRASVVLAAVLVAGVLGGSVYLFGSQISREIMGLLQRLPQDIAQLGADAQAASWKDILQSGSASTLGSLMTRMLSWGTTLAGGAAGVVLIVFGGIYFALEPDTYRRGLMKLVPRGAQERVAAALDECAEALQRWIGVQFIAMLAVGGGIAIGLTLAGVPSALALGLVAGVAELVPYVGPIASAVPIMIVALSQDTATVWWSLAVVVAVQQIENNILIPYLASKSVAIPPALALFALVGMGILFGPLGLVLGFPLTVVAFVMVKRLYVHEALGKPVEEMRPNGEVFKEEAIAQDVRGSETKVR